MSASFDRRTFLSRGAGLAAGAAVLGGGGLLAACGGSSPTPSRSGGGIPGVGTGTRKRGGTLNIGVEAEETGFNPGIAIWAVTGAMYGEALFDSLAYIDSTGKPRPYLLQSITPNADYTAWTLAMRSTPIHFHDGTLLDSSAIVANLEYQMSHSLQNGPALTNIASIKNPDSSTVVVTMKGPWIPFPYYLDRGIGSVMAPAMLNAPDGGNHNPIGTGPFKFGEWVPNDHLTLTRNTSYWQSSLPYLDKLVFHPIPDHQSRENSLKAGTIDIIHSDDTQTAADLMHDPSFQYVNDFDAPGERAQTFIQMNGAAAPANNLTVRQALAYAINRRQVVLTEYNGLSRISNGPFKPGSPYYTDTGYPDYNLARAQALMKKAEQEIGGPVSFTLGIINDAKDLAVIQLVQAMFEAAGAHVTIQQLEQAQYVQQAALGHYQVIGWRQFDATDPDVNYRYWVSSAALPVGAIALNFARNKDPQIDAALQIGRTEPDPNARGQAYQTVARRFTADLPYLWLDEAYWSVVAKPTVQNFDNGVFPDGVTKTVQSRGGFFDSRFVWLG